jgi:hypothetical protein
MYEIAWMSVPPGQVTVTVLPSVTTPPVPPHSRTVELATQPPLPHVEPPAQEPESLQHAPQVAAEHVPVVHCS